MTDALIGEEEANRLQLFNALQAELKAKYPLTPEILAQHSDEASPWLLIDGKIYDCTHWQKLHPAGPRPILKSCGKDATQIFMQVHSVNAKRMVSKFCLGPLWDVAQRMDIPIGDSKAPRLLSAEINPGEPKPLRISTVDTVSERTKRIIIHFDDRNFVLPITCGGHISITIPNHPGTFRSYSPVYVEPGCFGFIVKEYPDGKGSRYLHAAKPGDTILVRGPLEPLFSLKNSLKRGLRRLTLVAGGTGMAPLISVAREALKKGVCVVFFACFQAPEDSLLMDLAKSLVAEYGSTEFGVHVVLSRTTEEAIGRQSADGWRAASYHLGRISNDTFVRCGVQNPSVLEEAVVCGPPGFNDHCSNVLRKGVGFLESQVTILE